MHNKICVIDNKSEYNIAYYIHTTMADSADSHHITLPSHIFEEISKYQNIYDTEVS
jgi:hypothetical protein